MAWRPFQKDQNIKFVDKTKVNPSYLALPVDCKQVDPIMGTACPQTLYRVDMAFKVGGSGEGQLFGLKI